MSGEKGGGIREGRTGCANIVVAVAIACVLAASVLLARALTGGAAGDDDPAVLVAVVHDADGATHELPLDTDASLTVETSLGYNHVVVKDGEAYVDDADCDGHDCMHQGHISDVGQQVICLPHELWIEVVAIGDDGGQMDVDAVVGGDEDDDALDAVAR